MKNTWPEGVTARYLTVGGATVELRDHRFRTQYTWKGRPYVSDEWHEVDGFIWECQGCGTTGGTGFLGREPYLPNERQKANDDSNGHADACRSMPKP